MAVSGVLCAVDGCRSSKRRDKNLSFFSLPVDTEIRKTWIKLIARPDLARPETKRKSHFVCSLHFDPSVIKYKPQLQPNALPTKLLPSQPTTYNSRNETKTKECSTQTLFPSDPVLNNDWVSIVRESSQENNWVPSKFCVVCSSHFKPEDVYFTEKGRRLVKKTAKSTPEIHIMCNNEDEPLSEKEIKVFCPKCKTEITHTAEGIQDDQTKILVAKVYHYFEQEYEELKTIYGDFDLTPLSKFRQRTALATGVSESTVLHILQEEEGQNAGKRQELPEDRRRARKRYRGTNSSSEDDTSDDNAGNSEQSSNPQDAEMLVVKVESPESNNEEPEIYFPVSAVKAEVNMEQGQSDPISLDVKTEPQADVVDNTSETLALTEPAGTKRKGPIIPRTRDVISARQHSQGESSTAGASSSVLLTEELDKMTRRRMSEDERKKRRRLCERMRKQRIQSDPVLREELLKKDRERYASKKAAGLIIPRSQMTPRMRRILQKKNRISAHAYYMSKKAKLSVERNEEKLVAKSNSNDDVKSPEPPPNFDEEDRTLNQPDDSSSIWTPFYDNSPSVLSPCPKVPRSSLQFGCPQSNRRTLRSNTRTLRIGAIVTHSSHCSITSSPQQLPPGSLQRTQISSLIGDEEMKAEELEEEEGIS